MMANPNCDGLRVATMGAPDWQWWQVSETRWFSRNTVKVLYDRNVPGAELEAYNECMKGVFPDNWR